MQAVDPSTETVSILYWEDKMFGVVPTVNIQKDLRSLSCFDLVHCEYSNGAVYVAVHLVTVASKCNDISACNVCFVDIDLCEPESICKN